MIPFKQHHLLSLIEIFEKENTPLDLCISRYFRQNRALGASDRRYIANTLYAMIRWKGLIDYLCGENATWKDRLNFFEDFNPDVYIKRDDLPDHIRVSMPKSLFEKMEKDYGRDRAIELSLICNTQAPLTLRVNSLKSTPEKLIRSLDKTLEPVQSSRCKTAITLKKRINLFELPQFKDGLFEVQDEGSQLVSELVEVKPGQHVLDFCSGSGGKSLAIAPKMEGKGQLYLHDIRLNILEEAKRRLLRAGVQNYQITPPNSPQLAKLKHRMDWIVVDAPCSGTGTLRRNPDMKWKFDNKMVERLTAEQSQIFEKALMFLKPSGTIVYITCSLLKEENQKQLETLIQKFDLKVVGEPFQSFPEENGMDGFFGIRVVKKPM